MSVQELKSAVTQLSPEEAAEFARWYAAFEQSAWTQREPDHSRIQHSLEELNGREVQETDLDQLEQEMRRRRAA